MNIYEQVLNANLATAKEAAAFKDFPTKDTPPWLVQATDKIRRGEELTIEDIQSLQEMGTTNPTSLTDPVTR